jgi:hypothetical protein
MELKKIAAIAEANYIPFAPHNPSGPIANAATLQLAACCPNFAILEIMYSDVDYRKFITNENLSYENGRIKIGDAPGKLSEALAVLDRAGINIEYLYAFMARTEKHAYVVIRVENNEVAEAAERTERLSCTIRDIPKKGQFCWNEEGSESYWVIEREPTLDPDFNIKISIKLCRSETKYYEYTVRYKDFCYAVAKTCTEVLKSHGIYGYHHSVFCDDMHLRYLLFLKSVALDNFEARELTENGDKNGESSDFEKEMELLMFDL